MARSPNIGVNVLLGVILTVHAILLANAAVRDSPTFNEPAHLVAGVSYWKFGRFDVYKVNPPLVRLIGAAPVVMAGCSTDWTSFHDEPGARPEMDLGHDFCKANGMRLLWLTTLARCSIIPFSILGAYVCFCWGRALYGVPSGFVAVILWSFCPNILGHGHLLTCDVAATALSVTACFAFWNWLKRPSWWSTFISGLFLGLAELTKTTLVVFYPLWPILWLMYRWPGRKNLKLQDWLRESAMLLSRVALAVFVINCGYAFEDSFRRLRDYDFVSRSFAGTEQFAESLGGGNRFSKSWLGSIPVPLPANYLLGIDLQRRDFEQYGGDAFIGGSWSNNGWWYYYLYALSLKVPLGTLAILIIASTARLWTNVTARPIDELYLLSPAIAILALVSSQTEINEHMRYVLPVFPFFFIWAGRIATPLTKIRLRQLNLQRITSRIPLPLTMGGVALCWSIISSMMTYPHSMSYFNEIAGGPMAGREHLVHSNVDWGQDLLYLKGWLADHPEVAPLHLAYFGGFDPSNIGIDYVAPIHIKRKTKESYAEFPPGWYAISVNFLQGLEQDAPNGHGGTFHVTREMFRPFRQLKPTAMAGYSISIFHIAE
jgi:hypothetical protein